MKIILGLLLMLKVTTTILGTDMSKANAKRSLRVAEDQAIKFHRFKYMPLHFKRVARLRYPQAYKKAGGKYSRSGTSRKSSQGRRDVNKERRVQRGKEQSTETAVSEESRKRPVFDSGLTQLKVLKGGVKLTGRFDKRGITYPVPFYIKINPAGQLNKVNALNAINSQEETKLGRIAEKVFEKEFNKQTTRKRSK